MLVIFGMCLLTVLVAALSLIAIGIEYGASYFSWIGMLLLVAAAVCLVVH